MSAFQGDGAAASWYSSAEDFGQKVDLSVRIREILRNYPEGLSILKELIQNADDAGARTVRFCAAESRASSNKKGEGTSQPGDALSDLMKGPSLLAYNSAKFTDTDFKSIQRIGDSLKKDKNGTKTGRFGVGVNSTYHLTDVPMFVSGSKLVMFDPQATFVPGINPANPGKMIDCSKTNGQRLVDSLPEVFDPLKIFGCQLKGEEFNGTTFRFALRTPEQAEVSRLSRQSHLLEDMRKLLIDMASVAPTMLLFLKNVERIEIYDWKASEPNPTLIHSTSISNASENTRKRRSYVLHAQSRVPSKPQPVDYLLDIQSDGVGIVKNGGKAHAVEKWIVCNQLGGKNASKMAKDPTLSHMKLVPWAGVAARVFPMCDIDQGAAYCFLPLPVKTKLPIHVNGYFELSSNRRDVWWGDDMAGDGKARAEWNRSLLADIAAPCYARLTCSAIRTNNVNSGTYEKLFPQTPLNGPWKVLGLQFMNEIKDLPVLFSTCSSPENWVAPSRSLLLEDDSDTKLSHILTLDKLPLVLFESKELKTTLLSHGICKVTSNPTYLRRYFCNRSNVRNGALEEPEKKLDFAEHLLTLCKSDLKPTEYIKLSGCQFIPLASGNLAKFHTLYTYDHLLLLQLTGMGFSKLTCMHALRKYKNQLEPCTEWLLANRYEDAAASVEDGVDPYLICAGESASLLRKSASGTFVDLNNMQNPLLKKFFTSGAVSSQLNVLSLEPDMLADVISRALPRNMRGVESANWDSQSEHPNKEWFTNLWRYICSCNNVKESLQSVAEQYCIVPTQQGLVCSLSPGASVLDATGLEGRIVDAIVGVGVRTLISDILPEDIVVPNAIWAYIFKPTREGVIKALDAAKRRHPIGKEGVKTLENTSDSARINIFRYCADASDTSLSVSSKTLVRQFPIFQRYCDSQTAETKFVSMIGTGTWYVLEDASEEDKMFMTSDFLESSSSKEAAFLIELGAKKMKRAEFFIKVIVPQLSTTSATTRNTMIQRMLLEFPSLSSRDPTFKESLMNAKFIPSAESQTLRSPFELYDPEVPQLLTLMDHDSFPEEFFMDPNLLLSLRSLGLRSTLTWEVVLDCANSISHQGSTDPTTAKTRGRELLTFLDMNVDTYFPEFKKIDASRTSRLFKKMNSAIFEDSEQKRKRKELQAQRIDQLLKTKWIPVYVKPPHPFLPWPEDCVSVAAPVETSIKENMWMVSYGRRLVDGDVHSVHLKKLLGWLDDVSVKDVSLQLSILGLTFDRLRCEIEAEISNNDQSMKDGMKTPSKFNNLCQKISSEVGRIYHLLNGVDSEYEVDVMKSVLHGCRWLWMGDDFVSSDHVAFTSAINAVPYLFTVPPDLACFRNLLSIFNVRETFGSSDYCLVLNRMAHGSNESSQRWNSKQIELAVSLTQKISDDVLKLGALEIYAPTQDHKMVLASSMVYDDAPWLSKDLPGKKNLIYAHPKLSSSVSEKIGIKSVRKLLLQSNADMISFGENVVHEAFGQSESLTRRLKNIVEMYPEGSQQLNELIQNADDAGATVVKFVASMKQHGKSSLLGQRMSEWQGGALYCYNDSVFTPRDFENLSKIGQASKLEKLVTTGRFGLGFNSVFHWTDVPSLVSGDYLVMFDPHAKYVPGATDTSRGIKIRFTGTELVGQFPDQMLPYCRFGNDMKNRFQGTLFRFPFRNEATAAESEISKAQYGKEGSIENLLKSFQKSVQRVLLFLRHVKRVEVYSESLEDESPKLLYYVEVVDRRAVSDAKEKSGLESMRSFAATSVFGSVNEWNAISNYIAGQNAQPLSKEAFYSKLLRTPERQLPRTKHLVTIKYSEQGPSSKSQLDSEEGQHNELVTDQFLVCSSLGGGKCRAMACNPDHRDMKFLPWASVAAHLRRNGASPPSLRGNAFCFLPLPAETGFPIHINGYFELSANRRDIWFGDDMSGAGSIRSEWNRLLLWDVISPLYSEMLLASRDLIGPGKLYNSLWPVNVSSDIWKVVRSRVYELAAIIPLLHSPLGGGKWVNLKSAVLLDTVEDEVNTNIHQAATKRKLMQILLNEKISIVPMPSVVVTCMKNEACEFEEVNSNMVREWFKKPLHHVALENLDNAKFLLKYCYEDLIEQKHFHQLVGLPLIPLRNGSLGEIGAPTSGHNFYLANEKERQILESASFLLVDAWTEDPTLNGYIRNSDFINQTNIQKVELSNFVSLLSYSFPEEWESLPEVRWEPDNLSTNAGPDNPGWLSNLWEYIVADTPRSEKNISLFENTWQIVPTLVGDCDRTLQTLSKDMAVVNMTNPHTGKDTDSNIASILRCIGIRTLDTSVFQSKDKAGIHRELENYIQPSSVSGIVKALTNSFHSDLSHIALIGRMAARFQFVDENALDVFRNYLCDSADIDLGDDDISTLRSMPIFEVYGDEQTHECIRDNAFLPPSCADPIHLDKTFLKATKRKTVEFLERLGVKTMLPTVYYDSYICSSIEQNRFNVKTRNVAITKLLLDIPRMAEVENGDKILHKFADKAIVPNRRGQVVQANELYDPKEASLVQLVDDSMLPAEEFCQSSMLQSLRSLGMRTVLSLDGVLESARRIEFEAKNLSIEEAPDEAAVDLIRRRALALLNFLDDETVMEGFLKIKDSSSADDISYEQDREEPSSGSEEIEVSMSQNFSGGIDELNDISWLPIETLKGNGSHVENDTFHPPRRHHQLSTIGFATPNATRPKADEWLVSKSMDILSTNLRSNVLTTFFKWDDPPSVIVVATQVIALAQQSEAFSQSQGYKQILATVTSRIYEILDVNLNGSTPQQQERVLMSLHEMPWIWVGDKFVSTDQVAFDAPDNAKPFLYSVPNQMLCFNDLLTACGVRDSFGVEDYVKLLSSLSLQLGGKPCSAKQLDLAVFVARHMSRVSEEDMRILEKSAIFLPSKEGVMYNAVDMTFDDAPWLSAIVKRSRHVFVNGDIGNDAARVLGAKSLRDVLSAHQNGMVKIPCPKHEALRDLLSRRQADKDEVSGVVLELIELAEMKGAKQVSVTVDHRSHGTMSLLHPCLAPAQGPALLICFHDVAMEVDEVVRLTSPAKYYASAVSGNGGCGGSGFPRYGRGLCAGFLLTDCLQVLSGRSLLLFDPNGKYLIEDTIQEDLNKKDSTDLDGNPMKEQVNTNRREVASARNYGMSASFCKQFPDQFEPFLSLPLGIEESMVNGASSSSGPFYRGTVIRLPFRSKDSPSSLICEGEAFEEDNIKDVISDLNVTLSKTLLFTYNLQSVSLDSWVEGESSLRLLSHSRVSSSPLSRRNHLEELQNNTSWKKEKSKLGKIFKSSWVPEKTSYTLQISTRKFGNKRDIVDTFAIKSVLGPDVLRKMANTETLSSINLIPSVTIAAHMHSDSFADETNYKPAEGSIFVGLDTGIKTGLPFFINAPFFRHEWFGSMLLTKEDDEEFRMTFKGIRDVVIPDKYNSSVRRTLALYVWNRQALLSTTELIPSLLKEIRDPIQFSLSKNPRMFYRFWPFHSRINPQFKEFVNRDIYEELAHPDVEMYLTENKGFQSITKGCFASPEYPLNDASDYFLRKTSLFTTPTLVIEDLNHFGINAQQLTPFVARSMLKRSSADLSRDQRMAMSVLEYCLSDLSSESSFDQSSKGWTICRSQLFGLRLLPLSDGTVGTIGSEIIVATDEQKSMLPNLRSKFLADFARERLQVYFEKPGFMEACGLTKFGPKILSEHISSVLPSHWEGQDFVPWNPGPDVMDVNIIQNQPSKLWIYQFWRIVPIHDHDAVQMFRRWPLIPTKSGELGSCGNMSFISYICPVTIDHQSRTTLQESYKIFKTRIISNSDQRMHVSETRIQSRRTNNMSETEQSYWNMGKNMEVDSDKTEIAENDSDENLVSNSLENDFQDIPNESQNERSRSIDQAPVDDNANEENSNTNSPVSSTLNNENIPSNNGLAYDPNCSSLQQLHQILSKIQYPLLDSSYFLENEVARLLSTDRLGVSRMVMSSLNQCHNYWSTTRNGEAGSRLEWMQLESEEFDDLLYLLSHHQDTRLSLMVSDLTIMKALPIFETFSGAHITISDRDDNFTIDSSVDITSVGTYLPQSLQRKLLLDKPRFNELYEDLNIQTLNEATILQKFVLKEFSNMTIFQKEAVIKNIFERWEILRSSEGLLETLKDTSFVKRRQSSGEMVFVKPNQLYDPRVELLSLMFDNDTSYFPAEEFANEQALDILKSVGLCTTIDKEIFLKCAWIVEAEQNISKSFKLFEYFGEHFGEFFDNNQEFTRQLAEVQCVPAEVDGGTLELFKFRETAAPKDRHIAFKVRPVMHESACPPQVMFSSLGIISPPPITVVLGQIKALTENESVLDHWVYKYGSFEQVFAKLFDFLQENYSGLSPRVQEALRERPLVPVGTTLVKPNRLFFRLAKDLAPFFYEVPRAFGAYDIFLRKLGVRETPMSRDYAFSLVELNSEIGAGNLNANELKSAIEVVNLIASDDKSLPGDLVVFAPDSNAKLVNVDEMLQNDHPWLLQSGQLDQKQLHIAHPKMSLELCNKLLMNRLSEQVREELSNGFIPREVTSASSQIKRIEKMIQSDAFIETLRNLIPPSRNISLRDVRNLVLVPVEKISTRYVLFKKGIDITGQNMRDTAIYFCSETKILISKARTGLSDELIIAMAICDLYKVDRKHIAGISAILCSNESDITSVKMRMGLMGGNQYKELHRGEPGQSLVSTDMELIEIKPLRKFAIGEIVAISEGKDKHSLVYGVVTFCEQESTLSRLRVCISQGKESEFLSSEVYSLKSCARTTGNRSSTVVENVNVSNHIIETNNDDDLEESVVVHDSNTTTALKKSDVLTAVQDLLQSADLSLSHDTTSMLNSNLGLQEKLSDKEKEIRGFEKEREVIKEKLLTGADAFLCPITREPMEDPVICCDGHTYEREAIEMWLRNNSRSPKTNQPLATKEVFPNHALRSSIESLIELKGLLDSQDI